MQNLRQHKHEESSQSIPWYLLEGNFPFLYCLHTQEHNGTNKHYMAVLVFLCKQLRLERGGFATKNLMGIPIHSWLHIHTHNRSVNSISAPKNELGRNKEWEERRKREGRREVKREKPRKREKKQLGEHGKITFLMTYYYLL